MHRYIPGAAYWCPKTPRPTVIGAAASDAQAAVGVCWHIPARIGPTAETPRRTHGCVHAISAYPVAEKTATLHFSPLSNRPTEERATRGAGAIHSELPWALNPYLVLDFDAAHTATKLGATLGWGKLKCYPPTYLVVFELGVNTRENQFFGTNYLFKRAGHLLKLPVLYNGILHFSVRLSALFSRFAEKLKELREESRERGGPRA